MRKNALLVRGAAAWWSLAVTLTKCETQSTASSVSCRLASRAPPPRARASALLGAPGRSAGTACRLATAKAWVFRSPAHAQLKERPILAVNYQTEDSVAALVDTGLLARVILGRLNFVAGGGTISEPAVSFVYEYRSLWTLRAGSLQGWRDGHEDAGVQRCSAEGNQTVQSW